MFSIQRQAFGKWEMLRLRNGLGTKLDIIPSYGAYINRLAFAGQEIIEGFPTAGELENDMVFHNIWLFPFVNRLASGKYEFEDKSYQFPLNEEGLGNALHGFLFQESFELVQEEIYADEAQLVLEYNYKGQHLFYPFPAKIQLGIRLKSHSILFDIEISNTGNTNIPLAFGWHPYFTMGETIDDHLFELPAKEYIVVDDQMIPTGKRRNYEKFAEACELGDAPLDTAFVLEEGKRFMNLTKGKKQLNMSFSNDFSFAQVCTTKTRSSISVEPVTANIDALNNGDGLKILAPEEKWKLNIELACS